MARRTVTKVNPKVIMNTGSVVENSVKKETPKTTRKINNSKKEKFSFVDLTEPLILPISDTSTLYFKIVEVNGEPKVDIRTYVDTPKYTGRTEKGVHFPLEYLENFIMTTVELAENFQEESEYFEEA